MAAETYSNIPGRMPILDAPRPIRTYIHIIGYNINLGSFLGRNRR